MTGMQRFVTYLYYYKEEEKLHNAGFAKIEIRGGQCVVEIHLQGMEQIDGSPYGISEMKGIYIPVNERAMYASRWDDGEISRKSISIWEARQSEEEADKAEEPEMKIKEEQSAAAQKET